MTRIIMMDVDGVLVQGRPSDGAHLFTDLEADLGISLEQLRARFFAPRWQDIVTGRKALLPELSEVLAEIAPSVGAQTLIEYWFRNDSRLDRSLLTAMSDLRASGEAVYLATNQEHLRAAYLMENLGLTSFVDGIFYSAAIGHRKPERGFYQAVATAVGGSGHSIVLVDDTVENVEAAKGFGWKAVHWSAGMNLIDELELIM